MYIYNIEVQEDITVKHLVQDFSRRQNKLDI